MALRGREKSGRRGRRRSRGGLEDGSGHGADESAGQGDVATVFGEREVGDFGHPFFGGFDGFDDEAVGLHAVAGVDVERSEFPIEIQFQQYFFLGGAEFEVT